MPTGQKGAPLPSSNHWLLCSNKDPGLPKARNLKSFV